MEKTTAMVEQQIKALSRKRTDMCGLDATPGSTLRLGAILVALVALLLWLAQHILQAGLPVR